LHFRLLYHIPELSTIDILDYFKIVLNWGVEMEYRLDYKLIGERIKQRRLSMKLTQEKLSEAAGIGVQHLSKIENGKAPLSLVCLVALANNLKTTTDFLLMDNIQAAIPHLLNEAKILLDDCSSAEIYILLKTAATVKECIRHKGLAVLSNE